VWLNSGASKRQPGWLTKSSLTVAVTQQSWPDGNLYSGRRILSALPALDGFYFERPRPGLSQP
jgi:hypothetical protein